MVSRVDTIGQLPIKMIEVSDLYLDAQNPRRTSSDTTKDQRALIEEL